MTSQPGLRDLHLRQAGLFQTEKGFCPVMKINSWFIHLLWSFPVIFLDTRVAARWITNKMLRIVSTRGVFTGNGKCSNESHFALAGSSPALQHRHNITLQYMHYTAEQNRDGVINMANFLVNYWLTRTNNCLIIIPARLPTPVAGRHFSSEIGKISFQFDCWLLAELSEGVFSHCWFLPWTDSVFNRFIACIK